MLVTESTTEAFNILLPLLGGIVTDNGGLHSALLGLPGAVDLISALIAGATMRDLSAGHIGSSQAT